ncbi:uncharacterized protein [Ambystoma mexicanum]|uniref:uncharacterized protein isoform X3 n=1 Tax=Ambystoma mexicanum TaxID=8296 RepID=UPI0037E7382C
MSAKGPSLVPVTFHDVAVYFSEEEWEFLEDWQKDLYSSVMHEIHGVLISMGYAIVNPDTLFRIKKEEKPYISDHTPCKKRESFHDHASGSPVLCPDLLLRIKQEDEPVLYQPPGLKKRECILNPAPHHSTETSVISIRVKEEENDYMSGTQHSERTEHFSKPTSVPVVTSVFSLNKPADSSYSGGRQDLGKGFLEIPPGTSSLYNEEEGVAQAETEVEDAPEVSPREEQEHTAERTEMQSGPMAGPHQSEEQTGKEDMGKENQYPSVENTNKEATAKEAQPFTTEQHGKETTPNKVQTRVQRKKRNDGGIKEPTFAFMIKPKSQPHQNTTPLKAEENLRRETDLPNGDAGAGSQHLLRNILPLVEKLDTFVDLQNKQYETLKCSVRQINVHLRHQTRTLVKINTSIQKQTSAINRLARAQRASASNIETLAANVLRTNASLVEGNALLNKTLQGGLDMLQVIIKAHWQPHCSATAESSMAASPQLDPKTLEMTSLLRQTTGIRRLRRSPSGDRSSTHRKLRKRPINPSVAISPL